MVKCLICFKQKTAYEMRISDWSSDVCSSDLPQLATALKASSGAFADSSAKVGTGTLTFTVDGKSMSLELTDSNNSLAQVRDAINKASDNPGVSATIVNGSDGAHLVLSGTRTGAANGFTVSGRDRKSTRLNSSHSCAYPT